VNPLGVKFYNNVINELLHNGQIPIYIVFLILSIKSVCVCIFIYFLLIWAGIKPLVTLLHYDPPQSLYDEYGGFLSSKIVYVCC
jgi:beta-glucosidase